MKHLSLQTGLDIYVVKINTQSDASECIECLWMVTVAVSGEIRVGGRFTPLVLYILYLIKPIPFSTQANSLIPFKMNDASLPSVLGQTFSLTWTSVVLYPRAALCLVSSLGMCWVLRWALWWPEVDNENNMLSPE